MVIVEDAFHFAAVCNDVQKLNELLAAGADVNARDKHGNTALVYAAFHGHVPAIECLIDHGAYLEATHERDGWTALMRAALQDKPAAVRYLVQRGANINAADLYGNTALIHAAFNGLVPVVELLIEQGADLERTDGDGWTALMRAAYQEQLTTVRCLIERGANINAQNKDRNTALIVVSAAGKLDVVKCLVECGVDLTTKNKWGEDAPQIAANRNQVQVVEYFAQLREQPRPQQAPQADVVPRTTPAPAVDHFLLNAADVAITTHVGDGGQASVYQGTWLGVQVAVKIFHFGSNSRQFARMQKEIDREIAAFIRLRHPHIVQLYGYYQEPTKTGLVMEYCGGGDLSDYCIDKPLQEKLTLAVQVLAALRYLHAQGVVHGDVKPQNVLIKAGEAKLADFAMSAGAIVSVSVSISSESRTTATGTDAYSAPEVLENGRSALSPASDMYSVGMLLYHLVEEEAPWSRENNAFIVRQATAGKLPLFKSAGWNRHLEEFMMGCCAFDPASRYEATEALQRLTGILRRLPMPESAQQSMEQLMREMAIATMPDQEGSSSASEFKYDL